MTRANPSYSGSHVPIVTEVLELANPNYTVLVRPFALGQYRIQLTDKRKIEADALRGHGSIVRSMCTYKLETMERTVSALAHAADPEAFAESLVRPHNCEHRNGRIRLDTRPRDRPEVLNELESLTAEHSDLEVTILSTTPKPWFIAVLRNDGGDIARGAGFSHESALAKLKEEALKAFVGEAPT